MHFNIVLGAHPVDVINTARDHTLLIKAGIEEAGHTCSLSMTETFRSCVNIFYDYFTDEFSSRYFEQLSKNGVRYGLICTEPLDAAGNYYGVKSALGDHRMAETRKIAAAAEFLWVMPESSVPHYRRHVGHPGASYLALGYCEGAREIRHVPYEKRLIDFLFFGGPTPHRVEMLRKLSERGHVVKHIYNVPGFVRNSLVEQTKVNLSIKQDIRWPQPAVGRICYLVSNHCVLVSERTANGKSYEDYTFPADTENFIELCELVLRDEHAQHLANLNSLKMSTDLSMSGIMQRLIGKEDHGLDCVA